MDNMPLVSVVLTTKNEEKNIDRFCESVKNQTYSKIELIVVDNNSSDKTQELARKYTDKVYTKGPERSAQRNYAVEVSSGDYVLILDADMELSETVVEECVSTVRENVNIKAIVIPEKTTGEGFWGKCKVLERDFYYLEGDPDIEAARFFDKSVFLEMGGYDESISGGGEDWDLPERVYEKYPVRHRIQAFIIHHEGYIKLRDLLKKKFYYAKTAPKYVKKQKVSIIGPKTLFFLRPVFYRHWRLWLNDPVVSVGTWFMLFAELVVGGLGFLLGSYFS